jgi:HAD superfamily hydrolase (TIGR01549 family)
MLPTPAALLLDFGGVLVEGPARKDQAPPTLVLRLFNLIRGVLTPGEISRSLTQGADAYATWRDRDELDEISHEEVWRRFVTPSWPLAAQEAVRGAAHRLSYDWTWRSDWQLRPGIPEALQEARSIGLPLAVVSNTLCGAAHRDFLAREGVGGLFETQIYSDEVGVRKPNPEMIWYATGALAIATERCWYVGDSYRRDIVCARRASVGAAILFPSRRTVREKPSPAPDVIVADGFELRELLRSSS